jgi:hypothetical protein
VVKVVVDLSAFQEASSDNNVVGASARLRRAPEYTARKLWRRVDRGGLNLAEHG